MIFAYIVMLVASVFATYLLATGNILSGVIMTLAAAMWLHIAIQQTIDRSNG